MELEKKVENAGIEEFLKEKSEMGEAFDNLDNDSEDSNNRSKIDFNTRLTPDQISGIMVVDEMKAMGLLPAELNITKTLKRLNVSINGEGRKEKVQMMQGQREEKSGAGFFNGMFQKRG